MVKEVFAYLQTHWDREWYKTFEEYRFRLIEVIDDIVAKIESKEIPCFYLDGQTIALDDYLEIYLEKKDLLINLIRNNKLFVGPFYVLADELLVNGESLARNLLIGINEAKKYSCTDFIGYLPDAFGHSSWMPMILKKFGIENALVWRGVGEESQEFFWESPDKTKIKTIYLATGYFQDFFSKKSYTQNINNLLKILSKAAENIPILLPIGADHLACENKIKIKLKNFNRNNKAFKIKLSSLKEYIKATKNNKKLNTIKGELRNNSKSSILPSVYSSRIKLKQHNTKSQWLLSKISEPFYAISTNYKLLNSRQNLFNYAWKLLIQNQAHDSICGCSLDEVHRENITRFNKIEQLCNASIDFAKYNLAKKVSKESLLAVNLSNYTYEGVFSFFSDKKLPLPIVGSKKTFPIEISNDIHNIPVQENYKKYYEYLSYGEIKGLTIQAIPLCKTLQHDQIVKTTNKSIENSILLVKIKENGSIYIKNKINGKEFQNLHIITDEADIGDSYNFAPIEKDSKLQAEFKDSKILEKNDLRGKLKLIYTLKIPSHAKSETQRSSKKINHKFEIELTLSANSPRLDFKLNYENLSKDHILKLNFKLPQNITETTSEDTYGTIKRKYDSNYNYKELLPAPKGVEIDLNTGIFQRFVMVQGLCVLTKGLQEYEIENNNLNITLLRCFGIISKKKLTTRNTAAGPPLPTPEGQCIGAQIAEYSILLTDDTQTAFMEADFFYNPIVITQGKAKQTTLKKQTYLNLPDNFYVYNIKESEDKIGLIVKIFNLSSEEKNLIIKDKKEVTETNYLEEKLENKNLANKLIKFSPYELKVLKIK